MPDQPVALIIAAKDAGRTIAAAIESALRQQPVAEVVVVDDGSRDDTAAVAACADDGSGRLSIIRLESNVGPSAARNCAIAASTAPLIGILDADDYLEPGRVAAMLAQAPAQWDLLADNMVFKLQGAEDKGGDLLVADESDLPRRLDATDFVTANLNDPARPRRELGFLKPLMRREFLARHGLAYDERLRLGEDYVLYANALLRGAAFWLTRSCGYIAIERADSLSGNHRGSDLAALARADDALLALARNDAAATRALLAHRRATRLKGDYAQMLDAKRDGRIGEALGHLLRTPQTTAHILAATFKARLERARAR